MTDGLFDERIAASYDSAHTAMMDDAVLVPTIDRLAGLVGEGRALEFAIGTGRVALPLRERGVDVSGIELSRAMVQRLQEKPGGDAIPVTIGDMASTHIDARFSLVYLVYNTISNLVTQDAQVACFCNAAAHLEPSGYFVVEDCIPQLQRLARGETLVPFDVSSGHIGIDEYDTATQRLVSHHYWIEGSTVETFDSEHRYTWPAELDLMARIAGLSLVHRWSDWQGNAFTSESVAHVSVWQKR